MTDYDTNPKYGRHAMLETLDVVHHDLSTLTPADSPTNAAIRACPALVGVIQVSCE